MRCPVGFHLPGVLVVLFAMLYIEVQKLSLTVELFRGLNQIPSVFHAGSLIG